MTFAVIGVGGVGGYFGALLARAGEDVVFVARGEHGKAIKDQGLQIKSVLGNFTVHPIHVAESIAQLDKPDVVLFTVKNYDTEHAARELASVIGEKTIIITFQNGVINDLKIKEYIPSALVYPGVCYIISAKTKIGVIEQTGGPRKLIFGGRNNSANPELAHVEEVMRKAGIDAVLSDDITRDLWKKFIFITAFSGMTALTGKPVGDVLGNPKSLEQYQKVVRESIAVAKACGVHLPQDIFEVTMKTTQSTAPASKSSLLRDIEDKSKTEIETLNGALIRLAKNANIPVPMNEWIYQEIKKLTEQYMSR